MKMTIESTGEIGEVAPGVLVRVWRGTTEKGARVRALVHMVGIEDGYTNDTGEADDLFEIIAPSTSPGEPS